MTNPSNAYEVVIVSRRAESPDNKDPSIVIRGWLPKQINLTAQSQYDSPFQSAIANMLGDAHNVIKIVGISGEFEALSAQVWSGSSPMTLSMPIEFNAERDAWKEVVEKIVKLKQLALPTKREGVGGNLIPPGPTIAGTFGTSNDMGEVTTIRLGKFMRFRNVVITDVSSDIDMIMAATSSNNNDPMPMRATCTVTFRTYTTLTREDLWGMFT